MQFSSMLNPIDESDFPQTWRYDNIRYADQTGREISRQIGIGSAPYHDHRDRVEDDFMSHTVTRMEIINARIENLEKNIFLVLQKLDNIEKNKIKIISQSI